MRLTDFKGDWALVTGASSGIGREFCLQLAAAGMHLVMVARRKERMEHLAQELSTRWGTQSRIIVQDLSQPLAAEAVKAAVEAQGLRMRLLVNNAAFGPWGRFENSSSELYSGVIQLIASSTVSLCQLFMADLASFPSGAVINLSSPAAFQPVCYKAVYAAAKVFVHHFSLALHGEWKGRGILVQTLVPWPTRSELDERGGAYPCGLSPERYPPEGVVRTSLAHLNKGTPLVTCAKGTFTQRLHFALLPAGWVIRNVEKMFRPSAGFATASGEGKAQSPLVNGPILEGVIQ